MIAQTQHPFPYYKYGRLCFYDYPDEPGSREPADTESRLHAIWDKDREYRLVLENIIVTLFKPEVLKGEAYA